MNALASRAAELPWHLKGNWAPVLDEIDAGPLAVRGEIPRDLQGAYVRAGMNPKTGFSRHWFAGTGMLHAVTVADGRATYRNRFVRTPYYDADGCSAPGMVELAASPANTSIVRHAGRLLALEEGHLPWEVDGGLATIGAYDFEGLLRGPMTAHPRVCPETGELLFFGYQLARAPFLTYYRVSAGGELIEAEPIAIPRPVMMHDWNITRNHVVFMDLPVVFDLEAAKRGQPPLSFRPDAGARLGVMRRNDAKGDVRWFDIDPCYVFHPVNAHEEGDKIVLHVCRQNQAMVGGFADIYSGESTIGKLWRWTIDLASGSVREEQLDDAGVDFPRVSDTHVGLPARWGYLASLDSRAPTLTLGSSLYKYDLVTGGRFTHDFGAASHLGEPVFVPRPGGATEDDGWVMALRHDEGRDESSLVILDALAFESEPVAEVIMPRRVPYGAHGAWIAR